MTEITIEGTKANSPNGPLQENCPKYIHKTFYFYYIKIQPDSYILGIHKPRFEKKQSEENGIFINNTEKGEKNTQ